MTATKEEACGDFVLILLATALAWWPCYLWQGWLGAHVWRWFAVELFGARPLAVWQAAGVIALIHYFMPSQVLPKDPDASWVSVTARIVTYGFLGPTLTFISAWLLWRLSHA